MISKKYTANFRLISTAPKVTHVLAFRSRNADAGAVATGDENCLRSRTNDFNRLLVARASEL